MVTPGNVGMRTQAAFQVVLPDFAEDRVKRIGGNAALLAAQFLRQSLFKMASHRWFFQNFKIF
jgi:hypothetical protein